MNNTKIYLILATAMTLPISALFGQNSGNIIVIPEIANRFASGQFFVGGGGDGAAGASSKVFRDRRFRRRVLTPQLRLAGIREKAI